MEHKEKKYGEIKKRKSQTEEDLFYISVHLTPRQTLRFLQTRN